MNKLEVHVIIAVGIGIAVGTFFGFYGVIGYLTGLATIGWVLSDE